MKRSDVPAKHALPFALNGSRNAIPESGAAAGIATLTSGFPDETMQPIIAGGIPPDGKDMNGVLFELSAMGRWANAGAEYAWDETFSDTVGGYPLGARLLGSDGQTVFISMQDDNTTNPETVSAAWVGYNPGRSSLVLTSGIRTLTALEAAGGMVVLTGTLTGNMQLVFPAWVRQWDVINQTTGAYTVTCRTDTGGVQVLQGYVTRLYGDGRILNAWAAREVAGMVKSVNGHAPGVNGDVKLGSAADADIVTSMTDTTAGRATVVGWMGTGGPEIPIPDGTDIYKYFATAASGNYGGGSGLINAATTSGWVGFKWQQHGAGNKYGFLLEQASSGQMALHIYNNQNGDMTSPEKYWSNSGLLFSVKNPPTAVQTGALPNPGTLLTSIYDIAGSGIYAALGKGNEKPTEGMPDDSGNTRYTVLATEVYAGQYWVTLISKNEFYVGQVVISGKTANWCRYYNTGWKPTANDVGALPLAGGTMAPAGQISVSQVGRGMWTSQNTVGAPVFQDIDTTATSEYWPIFKQHYQQGNSTWSAGMLINEGDFHLHFLNSAGDTANFRWVKDGQFIPGNYTNFDNRYLTKSENIPAGIPLPWPTATPPSGWLICNGSAFNKTTCPQLAAVYPSGNLPDLRAQFIRGLDNGKNIDAGRAILSTQASQAPRSSVGSTYKNTTWNDHATVKTGYYMTTGTDNDGTYQIMAESETQRETRPTNVAFNYIVRAA